MLYHRFLLDTQRDYTFAGYANDITTYVKRASWQFGAMGIYDPIASPAYMELVLDNSQFDFNLQDTSAKYYGKVQRGTLVKAQASLDAVNWTTLCVLKIMQKIPGYTMSGDHELTLKATDILQGFLNQNFVAPLQTNVRVDEILDKLHLTRGALYPYESYYQFIGHTSIGDGKSPFDGSVWTDFETAETTLPYYGDNLDRGQGVKVQQYIKDAVQAEIFGLYWFSPRSERFKFISRYRASDTAVSWYITTAITDAPKYTDGRDLVNDFALNYYPRAIGAANSVLYSSDNVPFSIPARGTKRLTLKYRDPDNENASVGALVVNDLVKGVDIIANTEADGSGLDKTSLLDITLIKGASSSELLISNRKRGDASYITTLQLRGTPITAYNKEVAYGYNDDSIYGVGDDESTGNDRAEGSENLYAVSDIDFAQDYADFKVAAYGQPIQAIEKLSIQIQEDDTATQTQVLARSIGDVINFVDAENGHDLDYMIVAEQHSVSPTTIPATHIVTYTLRPSNRGDLFILGVSTSDEGAVLAF